MESFVTFPPEIAAGAFGLATRRKDRYEVLERGVPFLRDLARKHGLIS